MAATNFSSTRGSVFLDDMPLTSAGFSKATIAPAASFSQVTNGLCQAEVPQPSLSAPSRLLDDTAGLSGASEEGGQEEGRP